MLYDLTAIDERMRATSRRCSRASDFTVIYHLFSFERNEYIRVKIALAEDCFPCSTASRASGRRRTGTSAKCGICSELFLTGILTCIAF